MLQGSLEASNEQINGIVEMVRGKLPKSLRTTLSALTVIDVHARKPTNNKPIALHSSSTDCPLGDVIAKLHDDGINSINDFDWIAQLRYYWEHSGSDEVDPDHVRRLTDSCNRHV